MSRVIPNEQSWIGFSETAPADPASPTMAELDAATTITALTVSLNPTSTGNAIPTPALDSLFDRSVIGTSQGAFTGDFYRDDEDDVAWDLFPRGKHGWFYVSRFGGSGEDHKPTDGESLEVWEITVTQRAGSAMTSNTVQTFTVTAAVNEPPEEDAIVGGGGGTPTEEPSVPRNLTATPGGGGAVVLDFDAPATGAPVTDYKAYRSSTSGGTYTEITTGKVVAGTTIELTGQATGAAFYKVSAVNAAGEGPQTPAANCTVT